jgi:hypothetical protein
MKCFYHPQRDAVAMCKSCGRGLCPDCAAEVTPGMACVGRCERDVAALNLVIQRSKTAYQKTGRLYRRSAGAILILGLIFLAFGFLPVVVSRDYTLAVFLAPLGCVFVIWSYFYYRSGKEIVDATSRSEPDGAANRSQPVGLETNRTPPAGSGG